MFLTKNDVDKHCREVMSKCKNEKDRNLRCLSIAHQYYNVRDYEAARRYVISFLSVKDDSPVAHKLFAQCLEHLGENEKAVSEYKYSLSLDSKQPELYLKVCELYADNSVVVDKNEAKYWHDKAEVQFPYHPAVQKLKKKMFAIGDNQNGMSLESLLLDEVKEKPFDATGNAKLLNFYIDNGRFREAYDQAFKKKANFVPNLFWYQSCVEICKSYKNQCPTSLNEEFFGNYLMSLERSLALSVQDVKMRRVSIPEGVALLASFDEILSEATALKNVSERFLLILNHMYGQLCFHTAQILYRKAKWEDNHWEEMIKLISPLLLLSTASRFYVRSVKEDGTIGQILKNCALNSVYRFQQAGYILSALTKQSPKHFIEKIFHFCTSNYWRERICEIIYNTLNYKNFSKTSFFMKFEGFSHIPDQLPKNITDDIDQFLSVSETLYHSSLHHLVWIGVQYLNISNKNSICDIVLPLKFTVKFTGSLQFAPNSSSTYAENLSKIDIEAFLYACVYSAKSLLDHQIDKNKPLASYILPADVSRLLCTPEQDLWWDYVNQMINQSIAEEHYSRARSTIQRGIENIRLFRQHHLPLHLLILLGRTFANKSTVESDSDRASSLECRSLLYWKAALLLLEKTLHKENNFMGSKSMFEYQGTIITPGDASKLISEGKRYIGMLSVKEKNYSDSIFLNESFDEPRTGASTSLFQVTQSCDSADDGLLKTVLEQNIKIMDRLETLFNKQELLSSNQFQLFETISALSKKIDDVLIVPKDCYPDEYSGSEQPGSRYTAPQAATINAQAPPVQVHKPPPLPQLPLDLPSLLAKHVYPLPAGVQTDFPMFSPFGHAPLAAPNTLLGHYLATPPSLPQPSMFMPDTKETHSIPNLSIASSIFNTPSANTPARGSSTFSAPVSVSEALSKISPAVGESKFSNSFTNSSEPNEVPQTTPKSTFSFSATSSPFLPGTSPGSVTTGAAPAPHSFQIPNLTCSPVVAPSVQVPEDEDDSDDSPVEHDPIPDFKPIIPLPDEVEVKTGEEDEAVLFENRAKLYRFADKEWKERGVGPLKILKNKANGRVRILMRREVVHKICANHYLMESINLSEKGDRAWIYCVLDFADEETREEKLCVKFQTPEIANEFSRVFNANKIAAKKSVEVSPKPTFASPLSKSPFSTSSPLAAGGDSAKRVVIAPSVLNVQTPKKEPTETSKSQFNGFTFNAKPIFSSSPDKKEPAVDDKKKTPFSAFSGFSLSSLTRSEGESKLFSLNTAAAPAKGEEKPMFETAEGALDFSNLSNSAGGIAFTKSKDFKGFAGAGAPVFGMKAGAKPADKANVSSSSVARSSPRPADSSPQPADSTQDENADGEYEPTAEFTPVIPLPELVEVKTGEEGLEVLYEEHCKLFRFTDEQWKERGVGKMKILRDPKDGTIRLLMRRDQVHKVCCNQRLTASHELKSLTTTDKAWSWLGKDFSEGELRDELLCVRFKTVELAVAFKEAFNDAKARLSETPAPSAAPTTNNAALPSLSEMFKRDQSKWECKECYVSNKKEDASCVACQQPKDGTAKPETNKPSIFGSTNESFMFSANPTAATTTPTTPWTFGVNSTTAASTWNTQRPFDASSTAQGGFKFGESPFGTIAGVTANPSQDGLPIAPLFSFGNSTTQKSESGGSLFKTGFLFGNVSGPGDTESTTEKKNEPFSGPNLFSGAGSNTTATSTANSGESQSGGSLFKTGFLFGNVSGPGDTESTTEKKNEPFSGPNLFSGAGSNTTATSTANSDVFKNFSFSQPRNSGDRSFNADGSWATSEENKSRATISKQSSSDDIEFVSETKISEEERKLAIDLQLPENYYAYKYSDRKCVGCVGCDEDDRKNIEKESTKNVPEKTSKAADSSNIKNLDDGSTTTSESKTENVGFNFGDSTAPTPWLTNAKFKFGNIFNSAPAPACNVTPKRTEEEDSDSEREETVAPNENDPYFEPIIPLPDIVETRTGEEEETIIFCERSKLFRFDQDKKEWKERGIGELKVLHHPVQNSYRLLLRREQVHKVVLNQRITAAFSLQPLSTNASSWCWFGMNLPEESSEPVCEQLAARFKTEEIAKQFEYVISTCISGLSCNEGYVNIIEVADNEASAEAAENDGEEGEYGDDDSYEQYVDEEGIEDAMTEESPVVFDSPGILEICDGGSVTDYTGVIRLIRGDPDVPESEDQMKSFVEFSTHDIPSLYSFEITRNSEALLENNRVILLEEDPEMERKVTLQFQDKELSQEFFNIYEMMK